ncbi:hypothetical protein [Actinophytocola sediminis]
MIDVQPTLDQIDAVLAECDAEQLPPYAAAVDPAGDAAHLVVVETATRRLAYPAPPARRRWSAWPWFRR